MTRAPLDPTNYRGVSTGIAKTDPEPTPETQRYWDGARNHQLWLQRCEPCDQPYFYPRPHCPRCHSDQTSWFRAGGHATLYSYVINTRPAPGFTAPYVIAVVQLEEGPRLMTNLVGIEPDPAVLMLDMPLEVDFEDREHVTVPVFRPADSAGSAA